MMHWYASFISALIIILLDLSENEMQSSNDLAIF